MAVCQYGHYLECHQRDYRAAEDMYEKAHRFAPAAAMPLYARAHLRYTNPEMGGLHFLVQEHKY